MKKRALVIVAHPDDETIWMGGTILKSKDVDWTIFSLCRKKDKDRSPKFKKVCKYYGAKSIISDLEDEGVMSIKKSLPEIKERIIKKIAGKSFTFVFTHGYNGEYGHLRHKGVHKAVKELVERKKLSCEHLLFFSYELNKKRQIVNRFKKNTSLVVVLNNKTLKEKKNIVEKLYGFNSNSFESLSCLAKETFYENPNIS